MSTSILFIFLHFIYAFNLYMRFLFPPSGTIIFSFTISARISFTLVGFKPSSSAISVLFAETFSVRYEIIACLCAIVFVAVFYRRFLSPFFPIVSNKVILSGSKLSLITGADHPCFFQTLKMFGIPLPARSPTSMRLNILISVLLRGSETPPLFAVSTSMRNPPGLESVITSFFLMITRPCLP